MITSKNKNKRVDSDSSDDEDNEQIRQFLEATDQTLLTNDMFRNESKTEIEKATDANASNAAPAAAEVNPVQERPKSERYLNDDKGEDSSFNDLQITKQMQTHIWGKLSAIIESQVKFHKPNGSPNKAEEEKPVNKVKLVSDAKCYVVDDIPEEIVQQKKPVIKRRRVDAEPDEEPCWAAIAVSGESILEGKDMECWGSKRARDRRKESRLIEIIKS